MIDWSDLKLAITKGGVYNTTTGEKLWSAYSDRRYYSPQGTTRSADWSGIEVEERWKKWSSNNGDISFITTKNSADAITKAEQDIWEFSNANHLIRKAVVTGFFRTISHRMKQNPIPQKLTTFSPKSKERKPHDYT